MADVAANSSSTARLELHPLGPGSYSGVFEANGDKDWIAVTLQSGMTYRFYGSGTANGSHDTVMSLFDATGNSLGFDNDSGAGENPYFTFTPQTAATYFIEMKMLTASNFPGEYSLFMSNEGIGPDSFLSAGPDNHTATLLGQRIIGGAGNDVISLGQDGYNAIGEQGNDTLYGNANNNELVGGIGNDELIGYGGYDTMWGDGGNDTLNGGVGNDILFGGTGDDAMTGGVDDDTYYVDSFGDTVTELAGGGTADVVYTALNNYVLAAQVEQLFLQGGTTALDASGNGSDNIITGNLGANDLYGLGGNDILLGGQGVDYLIGGAGKDTMTGGGGLDVMFINALSESGVTFAARDVINTFAHGDKINLAAIDANTKIGGNQAFTFVSNFTGVAGQLQWDLTGISNTGVKGYLVQGDVNGDAQADFSLQIYTSPTNNLPGGSAGWNLAAWDFVL